MGVAKIVLIWFNVGYKILNISDYIKIIDGWSKTWNYLSRELLTQLFDSGKMSDTQHIKNSIRETKPEGHQQHNDHSTK